MLFKKQNQEIKFFKFFTENNWIIKNYFDKNTIEDTFKELNKDQLDWFKACSVDSIGTLIAAPRQKGKTVFSLAYLLYQSIIYNKKVAFVSNNRITSRLDQYPLTDYIEFVCCSDLLKFKGTRFDIILIDELSILPEQKKLIQECIIYCNKVIVVSSFNGAFYDELVHMHYKKTSIIQNFINLFRKKQVNPSLYNVFVTKSNL